MTGDLLGALKKGKKLKKGENFDTNKYQKFIFANLRGFFFSKYVCVAHLRRLIQNGAKNKKQNQQKKQKQKITYVYSKRIRNSFCANIFISYGYGMILCIVCVCVCLCDWQ